jgi:hypothetical protein
MTAKKATAKKAECNVPGCDAPAAERGLCAEHQSQWELADPA